ncbi:dephospho-CoA kinase [Tenacibaculum amylolyticum]|uniref:dephospho-CoA kinase n=1 Tax=Tenacibaculum amylolyticum TaxID=104269 RepID=UPI003895B5D8
MLIGVTGGIGSGKTTVANMFANFDNVAIYFADIEAKKLMNNSEVIKNELIKEFSQEVYKDGILNRPYLAGIVFKDKEKLGKLNAIVHPVVYQHLQDFVKSHEDKDYIIYENAILFENGSEKLCDKIITVTAPEAIRVERVVKRDQTTEKEVKNRIKNQWSDAKKMLQSHYVIHNLSITSVTDEVNRIHNNLTKR